MPCFTKLKKNQTIQQRATEVKKIAAFKPTSCCAPTGLLQGGHRQEDRGAIARLSMA